MTKMTLPVSFNEPTSLLQRVAEDMEYTDLLDTAADRLDSTERMVYVAAFAASEYASTIGRVAKPFNPLLGETYEYVRPDKGYRFFIEQVSHHPPIGAAWAEAAKWDYYASSLNVFRLWLLLTRHAGRIRRQVQILWQVLRYQPSRNLVPQASPSVRRRGALHMEKGNKLCDRHHYWFPYSGQLRSHGNQKLDDWRGVHLGLQASGMESVVRVSSHGQSGRERWEDPMEHWRTMERQDLCSLDSRLRRCRTQTFRENWPRSRIDASVPGLASS